MIYDKHKLIHLAIPKTGTSCIFNMIYEAPLHLMNLEGFQTLGFVIPKFEEGETETLGNIQITEEDPLYEYYKHGHVPYKRYEKMLDAYPQYKKYKFFTFVRNPYDIMVSKYFYELRSLDLKMSSNMPFSIFCRRILNGEIWRGHAVHDVAGNIISREYLPPDELIPTQTEFLKNTEGKIEIDFIGKLEKFTEDWDKLRELFSTLPFYNTKYREANKSRQRDFLSHRANFAEVYDQETKNLVLKYFEEDFDTFKYSTDLSPPEMPFNACEHISASSEVVPYISASILLDKVI